MQGLEKPMIMSAHKIMLWRKINNDLHSFPTRLSFVNMPYKNVFIIIIIIPNILFFTK